MDNPALDAVKDSLQGVDDGPAVDAVRDHIAGLDTASQTLAAYLEANPKRSATTTANYHTTLKLWIAVNGDKPLLRVTRTLALDWLEKVGEGKAKDTVKRYATVMTHLWEWGLAQRRHEAAQSI